MAVAISRSLASPQAPVLIAENTLTSIDDYASRSFLIKRVGELHVDVYLGNVDVNSATGFPWEVGDLGLSVVLEPGEKLYAVTSSGTQELALIRVGR